MYVVLQGHMDPLVPTLPEALVRLLLRGLRAKVID